MKESAKIWNEFHEPTGMGFGIGLNFGSAMAHNMQMAHQNRSVPQSVNPQQNQQPPIENTPSKIQDAQVQPTKEQNPNTATCANCKAEITQGSLFCSMCGEKIVAPKPQVQVCRECGNENVPEALFCNRCGNSLKK